MWTEKMNTACKVLISESKIFFNRPSEINWEKTARSLADFKKERDEWFGKINTSKILNEVGEKISADYEKLNSFFDLYRQRLKNRESLDAEMGKFRNEILTLTSAISERSVLNLKTEIRNAKGIIFGFIIAALLIGSLFSFFL